MTKTAVVHDSPTGFVHQLARATGAGTRDAEVDSGVRPAVEVAPQAASRHGGHEPYVTAAQNTFHKATDDSHESGCEIALGTPRRNGTPSAQLNLFIVQAGLPWSAAKLADKVASSFAFVQHTTAGSDSIRPSPCDLHYRGTGGPRCRKNVPGSARKAIEEV